MVLWASKYRLIVSLLNPIIPHPKRSFLYFSFTVLHREVDVSDIHFKDEPEVFLLSKLQNSCLPAPFLDDPFSDLTPTLWQDYHPILQIKPHNTSHGAAERGWDTAPLLPFSPEYLQLSINQAGYCAWDLFILPCVCDAQLKAKDDAFYRLSLKLYIFDKTCSSGEKSTTLNNT